jgi:hypothetical protein
MSVPHVGPEIGWSLCQTAFVVVNILPFPTLDSIAIATASDTIHVLSLKARIVTEAQHR